MGDILPVERKSACAFPVDRQASTDRTYRQDLDQPRRRTPRRVPAESPLPDGEVRPVLTSRSAQFGA